MSDKKREEKQVSRHEVVGLLYTACARLDSYERPDWIVTGLTELAYHIGRGGAGFVEDVEEEGKTFDLTDLDPWDMLASFVNLKSNSKGTDKVVQLQDELDMVKRLIMFALEIRDAIMEKEKV